MRLVLRRRRVDILLAPNGGRSYPNLTDHREKRDLRRRASCEADRRYAVHDRRRVRARTLGCGAVPTGDRTKTGRWQVNILLLSLGGGGGAILRSVKALFRQDLMVTQKTDGKYADRLRRAVTTRFLDTNEFSLTDVPKEERLLIGARTTGLLGARHDPRVAAQALEESRAEVEALLRGYSVVFVIGTGGKGTGAGTMFPVVQMAREQRKLVIPIFVRPSFDRHEVDKRRYDHALRVIEQFDRAKIRLIEILNDRGYADIRSAAAGRGLGADEPADCPRAAGPDLRAVRSLASGSFGFGHALRRRRPAPPRVLGNRPAAIPGPERPGDRRGRPVRVGRTRTMRSKDRLVRRSSASRETGRMSPTRRSRAAWRPWPRAARRTLPIRRCTRGLSVRHVRGESRRCLPRTRGRMRRLPWTGWSIKRATPLLSVPAPRQRVPALADDQVETPRPAVVSRFSAHRSRCETRGP